MNANVADTGLQLQSLITKNGELRVSLARMKVPEPKDDEVCRARRRHAPQSVSACCSGFGVTADLIAFTDRSAVC